MDDAGGSGKAPVVAGEASQSARVWPRCVGAAFKIDGRSESYNPRMTITRFIQVLPRTIIVVVTMTKLAIPVTQ